MRAYVLSIGSELIGGHLTDTNATFLAQELAAQGIELLHVVQVGDDLDRLTRTLATAVAEADLVICTGGDRPDRRRSHPGGHQRTGWGNTGG